MVEITLSHPHTRPRTQNPKPSFHFRCGGIMAPRTYWNPQPKLQGHLKAEVGASEGLSPWGLGSGGGRGKHFRVTRKRVGWERWKLAGWGTSAPTLLHSGSPACGGWSHSQTLSRPLSAELGQPLFCPCSPLRAPTLNRRSTGRPQAQERLNSNL